MFAVFGLRMPLRSQGRGTLFTVAGNGPAFFSGDGGPATSASINGPADLAVDGAGNLYIADGSNNRIRKISTTGVMSTVAGNGSKGFSGDGGPATSAAISPGGVAVDSAGNIYIADFSNNRIRKVTPQGIISTVAGGGSSGDGGQAVGAALNGPSNIALDKAGTLYISEFNANRIRKVSNGIISTVAGTGTRGFSGDGAAATAALLSTPTYVQADNAGNLYIADYGNNRIRKVDSSGVISTVAGNGTRSFAGDGGTATNASLSNPSGVALDNAGNFYICDMGNARIRKVTGGVITTVAGSATRGFAGDGGPAINAQMRVPAAVALDLAGNFYIADVTDQRIRVVAGLNVSPASLALQTQSGAPAVTQSIAIGNSGSAAVNWAVSASTTAGGNWLTVSPNSGSVGAPSASSVQVSVDARNLAPGVYTGILLVTPGLLPVSVSVVVSPSGAVMLLGQTGIVVTGTVGGTSLSQAINVANVGAGNMSWTSAALRGSGIAVTPPSGSSAAGAAAVPTFLIQANPAGLAAGSYYGLIQVAAAGASNSPQLVSTVFNVLPAGSTAPVQVYPQGLIFVTATGTTAAAQTVNLSSPSAATASVSVASQTGGNWLSVSTASVAVGAGGTFSASANAASLAAGVYTGTITVTPSDGAVAQQISASLIVTPAPGITPFSRGGGVSCTPAKLVIAMRQLGNNFSSPVGWPVNLEGQAFDDCGNPALGATVVASFSNGDAPLALVGLGNGLYSATWKPSNANPTTVTVRAAQTSLASAIVTVNGQVAANSLPPPSIGSGGVVNAASFAPGVDLAPGSIVSVFGSNLGSSDGNLAGFPLPSTLANIKLTVGGIDAPLFYAGKGQVNAQIPFELTPGSQSQVVARAIPSSGGELDAVPEPVAVGVARPGIFIAAGTQGAILNVANQVVDSAHPAGAGDVIVIFCTGLGALDPPAKTGQPANSGVAVVPPSVTVGGIPVTPQYAGVAPGFVGLYQVNVAIPAGTPSAAAVPVQLIQNGGASNIATIAVR